MTWFCEHTQNAIKISRDGIYVCEYKYLEAPFCEKCSSPGVEYEDCIVRPFVHGFNRIHALGIYLSRKRDENHMLSKHIRLLKYYEHDNLATPLGTALSIFLQERYPELLEAEYIVPVPNYYPTRNHTELLMSEYCTRTGQVPLPCLRQLKPSGFAREGYGIEKRFEEVKGMFEMLPNLDQEITGKYALLLDDVVTSCSQASACSQILIDHGIEKVDVITLGRNALDNVH